MTIPALPSLDRTSATFKTDLDAFFLTQLPATIPAFNAEIERINLMAFGAYSATSSTSLAVGTGIKSLTIDAGKSFAIGQPVLIASTAAPVNWMHGQVTAYDSGTGALTVNVATVSGSGTVAAWSVSVTAAMASAPPTVLQRTITSADTLIAGDRGKLIDCSGTFTLSVTAAATLGNGWFCYLRNTSNGDVTVDPNASELIDGAATYVLKPGFTVLLTCTGTAIDVLKIKERTYTNIASHTASGTFVVPADTYVIRGYAWGAGANGTASQGGAGGGCAYGDIAVTPGETVSVSISSGVATVTAGGTTRLTANAAATTTGGTATKHASVTDGGAYAGGNSVASASGGGSASGSPLGVGGNSVGQIGGAAWGGFAGGIGGAGVGQSGQNQNGGGSLRTPVNLFTDPLVAVLTGSGGIGGTLVRAAGGGLGGGGGGATAVSGYGGSGGTGAGGGGASSTGAGGAGGFGGGGGAGYTPGAGGLGGGGGGSGLDGHYTGGTGGAACVLIYY